MQTKYISKIPTLSAGKWNKPANIIELLEMGGNISDVHLIFAIYSSGKILSYLNVSCTRDICPLLQSYSSSIKEWRSTKYKRKKIEKQENGDFKLSAVTAAIQGKQSLSDVITKDVKKS